MTKWKWTHKKAQEYPVQYQDSPGDFYTIYIDKRTFFTAVPVMDLLHHLVVNINSTNS